MGLPSISYCLVHCYITLLFWYLYTCLFTIDIHYLMFSIIILFQIHWYVTMQHVRRLGSICYAALLPRRGPHYASHSVCPSVCLSVCPSVCLSVCPSVCPSVPLSLPSVTYRHLANYNDIHVLFGTRWGPHIVRPSRPHRFLFSVNTTLGQRSTDSMQKLDLLKYSIPNFQNYAENGCHL